jgi:hypothetical protein
MGQIIDNSKSTTRWLSEQERERRNFLMDKETLEQCLFRRNELPKIIEKQGGYTFGNKKTVQEFLAQ